MEPMTPAQIEEQINKYQARVQELMPLSIKAWSTYQSYNGKIKLLEGSIEELSTQLRDVEKRLPCPLCGSYDTSLSEIHYNDDSCRSNDVENVEIYCKHCFTTFVIEAKTRENALKIWNNRPKE